MTYDFEQDPAFKELIQSLDFPAIELIAKLARHYGITEVREFWDLFELIESRRRAKRDYANSAAFSY